MLKKILKLLLLLFVTHFGTSVYCQENNNFSYLIQCFNKSAPDTSEIEVEGIGDVNYISLGADDTDAGLNYYSIPLNKRKKSAGKLAELASDMHKEIWKNNSRTIVRKTYKTGTASIIDLRLLLLIENIYFQVIVICDIDNGMIYETMLFSDTDDPVKFDSSIKSVTEKTCL
jgi:hypothetical protein